MDRRQFTGGVVVQAASGMALLILAAEAKALSLSDADASAGLKAAL